MQPTVSIVLPVRNGENYLKEAIENILQQTFRNFELIIGDNKSTDNSLKIAEYYANIDKRIKIISNKEDLGCFGNYNKLIRKSLGKYILITAHDDLMAKNRIEEKVNFLEKNPHISMVGCHMVVLENNTQRQKIYPPDELTMKFIYLSFGRMITSPWLAKREVHERFTFNTHHYSAGDFDFVARVLTHSEYKIANIPSNLYFWRMHDSNFTRSSRIKTFTSASIISINFLSKVYRVFTDPIIEKTLYALKDNINISPSQLQQTREAIISLSDELKNQYMDKCNFRPDKLLLNQYNFLLSDNLNIA